MWFCNPKHVIALLITDHWACFKDVAGEQFAEAFCEAYACRQYPKRNMPQLTPLSGMGKH